MPTRLFLSDMLLLCAPFSANLILSGQCYRCQELPSVSVTHLMDRSCGPVVIEPDTSTQHQTRRASTSCDELIAPENALWYRVATARHQRLDESRYGAQQFLSGGRTSGCDMYLTNHLSVARHCYFRRRGGNETVRQLRKRTHLFASSPEAEAHNVTATPKASGRCRVDRGCGRI